MSTSSVSLEKNYSAMLSPYFPRKENNRDTQTICDIVNSYLVEISDVSSKEVIKLQLESARSLTMKNFLACYDVLEDMDIGEMIESNYCPNLKQLDVSYTNITDKNLAKLCQILSEHCPIESINASGCKNSHFQIFYPMVIKLVKAHKVMMSISKNGAFITFTRK